MDFAGLTFDDVLLQPNKGILPSRQDADISVPELGLDIPLIASPMPSVATPQLLNEIHRLGGVGVIHRMNKMPEEIVADWKKVNKFALVAIGIDRLMFDVLYGAGIRDFVLDVAHAHSEPVLEFVEYVTDYEDVWLMAGSVATMHGAHDLAEAGADALRVGIGPGSACTTRMVTGFGVPQLEAITECAEGASIPIIADGGIRNSGDIAKAIAAGASAVMIGGLFANTVEAGATGYHWGNASHRVNGHRAPEGIEIQFDSPPERLEDVVKRLTWGLKSAISYAGGNQLSDLEHVYWIRLSDAGRRESKLA